MLVGETARLMAANRRYRPAERPWLRLWGRTESSSGTRSNGARIWKRIALGNVEQGGDIGEGGNFGFEWLRRLMGTLSGSDHGVDVAEIDSADNLGFAVDSLAVAGVVIGVAINELWGKARHT